MRAVWLAGGAVSIRDIPVPTPPPGEALIRVLQAGVCNTDLELIRGYYPYDGVLGHEFVGEVVDGPPGLAGRRVVGEINAVCGRCAPCRAGCRSHCASRTVLGIVNRHGVFAEYTTLPVENLHAVPDHVSTDAATFVEPLAAALQVQEQVSVGPDDRVLVVGDGKLGQLVAATLHLTGCRLTVLGRHERKLAHLKGLGIDAGAAEPSPAGGFDIVVECTGNPDGFAAARRAVRPRGSIVLKSTYAGRLELDVSAIVVDEVTLVGSRCGPFDRALALLSEGRVSVEPLIDARFPLSDAAAGFGRAVESGVLKVLLAPDG